MFKYILTLFVLALVLWMLARLRDIREGKAAQAVPSDEHTVLLGLFYTLSKACISYYQDYGSYPPVIEGAPDGLMEKGYLVGDELASMTNSLSLFSIVIAERHGYGICLENCTSGITEGILERADKMGGRLLFMDFKSNQYVTLTRPIKNDFINLTLPLPLKPKSLDA
uniref:Uncharacterized protein n=1 Tax=Magnetococcus massalia (strain MO-1) TaxID=451514 RepID=A0A1S7LN88_MAGMO|nr:conserved protein of unknown function [Candidatus Magnetococcus massalia]